MSRPTNTGNPPSFAALVQVFFAEHLIQQRAMSPRTVAAYRDAFVLFLRFAEGQLHKQPTTMRLHDITRALILAFLDHLEHERGNAVRSRNARLAALRAFLKFAAHRDVTALHVVEQALGVPMKRFERPMLVYLSREEVLAIIGKPGHSWTSQRDHLLLTMLYNTGARVSEITGVRVADVVLDGAACVHLHGKGRKQRTVPLWPSTLKAIRAWLRRPGAAVGSPGNWRRVPAEINSMRRIHGANKVLSKSARNGLSAAASASARDCAKESAVAPHATPADPSPE
jgi:site-specific recombinase XerD